MTVTINFFFSITFMYLSKTPSIFLIYKLYFLRCRPEKLYFEIWYVISTEITLAWIEFTVFGFCNLNHVYSKVSNQLFKECDNQY